MEFVSHISPWSAPKIIKFKLLYRQHQVYSDIMAWCKEFESKGIFHCQNTSWGVSCWVGSIEFTDEHVATMFLLRWGEYVDG